eukprot:CAMPEP_0204834080 /NCGR_PEP_ID=MMETSP1346-20131115/18635_1 /ASSEMBLY_ACC=CAM_ASM_000771 /TAXON_ID=215587 /ORGANISM="Aplanochytrium stocchinoi, Strain GSBS06" /LENGTH=177 /DNA_ID=CAMNT_0051967091 /DNA_START=83 /DNA_END=616 /DNA_ORIENTATION=-
MRKRGEKKSDTGAGRQIEVTQDKRKGHAQEIKYGIAWYTSCVLVTLFGALGFCFTLKEFGDPWFSDFVSPGPGQALLGDGGRMLVFETGDDGIQSKIFSPMSAWLLEGILLGLGSVGMFCSWSRNPTLQLLSAYTLPLEGVYYSANIVYFILVKAPPEAAVLAGIMGAAFFCLPLCT